MSEKHYKGGCQCGAISYEVDVDIDKAISCNCSRCKKMGFVLAFAARENFKLLSGQDDLTDYRFNKKEIQYRFCAICGVESFAFGVMPDGAEMAAINVNCLEGVDSQTLEPQQIDGASL